MRAEEALRTAAAREVIADQLERRELAEQLHGGVEQQLALVGLKLAALHDAHGLPQLEEITEDLRDLARSVAALGIQLSPSVLFDLGLVAAAQWLAEEFERRYGLRVRAPDIEEIKGLDDVTRITAFRTLREFLLNVVHHAHARETRVCLRSDEQSFLVAVEDSGIGFDPDRVRKGLGLLNIRERLEHLGGRLEVRSRPGEGTRACAYLPLRVDVARVGDV